MNSFSEKVMQSLKVLTKRTYIVGSILDENNGYIRYSNGFQVAWKKMNVEAGGTQWTNNIFFSDHELGEWKAPFTNIFNTFPSISSTIYWCTNSGGTEKTAGTIRCFRPTNTTLKVDIGIVALGMWK